LENSQSAMSAEFVGFSSPTTFNAKTVIMTATHLRQEVVFRLKKICKSFAILACMR